MLTQETESQSAFTVSYEAHKNIPVVIALGQRGGWGVVGSRAGGPEHR